MKRIFRNISLTVLYLIILGSCATSTHADIEEAVSGTREIVESKSDIHNEGYLTLRINNAANNTSLQVDSLEICNILLPAEAGKQPEKGDLMLHRSCDSTRYDYGTYMQSGKARMSVQRFNPWPLKKSPEKSGDMYVKIYGKMYTFIAGGTLFPLYEGAMYFTFNGSITEGQTTEISFDIYDNCHLYCEINGEISKVLQSINFDVSVEDWKE